MCWTSPYLKKLTATEDVVVYKLLTRLSKSLFESPIYRHPYTLNVPTPKVDLTPFYSWIDNVYIINSGYHSFNNLNICRRCPLLRHFSEICQCTIPKGSEYYVSEDEEVVSNQLIVKKVLYIKYF